MKLRPLALLVTALALSVGTANAADKEKTPAPATVPATYPLKTCPVSGDELGEMGKPIKVSNEGTDVYLCCKSCIKDFNKDPAKYTKIVKEAGKKS